MCVCVFFLERGSAQSDGYVQASVSNSTDSGTAGVTQGGYSSSNLLTSEPQRCPPSTGCPTPLTPTHPHHHFHGLAWRKVIRSNKAVKGVKAKGTGSDNEGWVLWSLYDWTLTLQRACGTGSGSPLITREQECIMGTAARRHLCLIVTDADAGSFITDGVQRLQLKHETLLLQLQL